MITSPVAAMTRSLPSFVAATKAAQNGGEGASGDITINKPSGVAEGDLMVAFLHSRGSDWVGNPSGWTKKLDPSDWNSWEGSSVEAECWYKVAGSSEGSDYTWTVSSDSADRIGVIVAYRNVDKGTIFDAASSEEISSIATTNHTLSPAALTDPNQLLVGAWFLNRDGTDALEVSGGPSEMDERIIEEGSTGTRDMGIAVYDEIRRVRTAPGNRTLTTSSGARSGGMVLSIYGP